MTKTVLLTGATDGIGLEVADCWRETVMTCFCMAESSQAETVSAELAEACPEQA